MRWKRPDRNVRASISPAWSVASGADINRHSLQTESLRTKSLQTSNQDGFGVRASGGRGAAGANAIRWAGSAPSGYRGRARSSSRAQPRPRALKTYRVFSRAAADGRVGVQRQRRHAADRRSGRQKILQDPALALPWRDCYCRRAAPSLIRLEKTASQHASSHDVSCAPRRPELKLDRRRDKSIEPGLGVPACRFAAVASAPARSGPQKILGIGQIVNPGTQLEVFAKAHKGG